MKNDMIDLFLEVTGYGRTDILARNNSTRIVLTRNGGKYKVGKAGVKHLAGPAVSAEDRD